MQDIIITAIKTNFKQFDEEAKQVALEAIKQSLAKLLLVLLKDVGCKTKQLLGIVNTLQSKVLQDRSFAQQIGPSFVPLWVAMMANQLIGLKSAETQKLLQYASGYQYKGDLKEYLLTMANQCKLKINDNPEDLEEIIVQIDKNPKFSLLKQACQKVEEVDPEGDNDDEERQKYQCLDQLKKIAEQSRHSILDELIQKNLVRAFEGQYLSKSNPYTKDDFQKFKDNLLKAAQQLGVDTYQLKGQLQSDLGDLDYYNKIINIRSKIHPIFVPDLVNLLQKNKIAQNTVASRDIVVILGVSGAGKSTLVQSMLGYTLKLKKCDTQSKKMSTLIPVGGLKPQHRQFVAKASSKSVTKYISAINWRLPQQYETEGTIYLADTPGFFDSGGLIVDTNNGLSTIRTLCTANSIRFIFLINYKVWGLRGEGFKKLAKLISKIFSKYDKNKVIFFLNCITKQQLVELPSKIKDLKEKLNSQQKGDLKFVAVVNHFKSLIDKADETAKKRKIHISEAIKQINQLVVMNPTSPDVRQIYDKVLHQDRKTQNPSQYLASIIPEQAREALRVEANNLETITTKCLKENYLEAALYYINNLGKLAEETQEAGDIALANKKIKNLIKTLEENFEVIFLRFQKCLSQKILTLRTDQTTIQQARDDMKKLYDLEKDYKKIPGLEQFNKGFKIQGVINSTKKTLLQKLTQKKSKELIEIILLFSKYFDQELRNDLMEKLRMESDKLQQDIHSSIQSESYQKLELILKEFEAFSNLVRNIPEINKPFEGWKEKLVNKLQQRNTSFELIIEKHIATVVPFKDSDIENIRKSLDIFSKAQSIQIPDLETSSFYRNSRRKALQLARKYVNQIRKFVRSENHNISNSNGIMLSKKNVGKIISAIQEIREEVENELNLELSSLSQMITSKTHSIVQEMEKIERQQWVALKSIHSNIKFLKRLTQICEGTEKQQCMRIIAERQETLHNRLNNFLDQLKRLTFTLQTANHSLNRVLRAYSINTYEESYRENDKKEKQQDKQTEKDTIIEICRQIKEEIKNKIQQIIKEVNDHLESKKDQKVGQIEGGIHKILKIKKFFDQIRLTTFQPRDLNEKLLDTRKKFQKFFNDMFKKLSGQILRMLKEILQHVSKKEIFQKPETIQRDKMYQINRLRHSFMKIKSNTELTLLLSAMGDNSDHIESQINNEIIEIKVAIQSSFQQNIQNSANIKLCFQLTSICQPLKLLDNVPNTNGIRFDQVIAEFKRRLDENVRAENFDMNPQQITRNGTVDVYQFNRMCQFWSGFGQNTPQRLKLKTMIDVVRTFIRNQQKALDRMFLRPINKNIIENQNETIGDTYIKIQSLLVLSKEVSEILQNNEKLKQKPVQINKDILQKISKQAIKIVEICEKKILANIQNGGKGYQQAENLIEKIAFIQVIMEQFKIDSFKGMLAKKQLNAQEKVESLKEYYEKYMESKKTERSEKYLSNKEIKIDEQFANDYETFSSNQKTEIQNKVISQVEKEIEKILEQSYTLDEATMKQKFTNLKNQKKSLPTQMREKIKNLAEKTEVKQVETRNKMASQAREVYSFSQSYDLLQKQNRQYIIQIYKLETAKALDNQISKINTKDNSQDIVQILQKGFVQNFKDKDMNNNPKFGDVYMKKAENAVSTVRAHVISKKTKSIKEQVLSKKPIGMKEIQQLKNSCKQVNNVVDFLKKNKKSFPQYDQEVQVKQISHIAGELKRQLTCKTSTLTFDLIKQKPKMLQSWFFEWQCLKSITTELETFSQEVGAKCEQQLTSALSKYESIKSGIDNLSKILFAFQIYSQSMKNFSDQQRSKLFEEFQQNMQILNAISTLNGDIFNEDFKETLDRIIKKVQQQIKSGINRSCEAVSSGFTSSQNEFNMQINITLSLLRIGLEKFSFIKIEKEMRQKLMIKLENTYSNSFREMENSEKYITDLKEEIQKKRKELKIKSNPELEKKEKQIKQQLEQKLQNLDETLKKDLENQPDVEAQKSLEQKCSNEKDQLNRQAKQEIDALRSKCLSQEEKAFKKQEEKLNDKISSYCENLTTLYKAQLEVNYKQTEYQEILNKKLKQANKGFGKRVLNQVYETLKTNNNSYANYLINNHQTFKNYQALQWEAKVKGNGIDYVLQNIYVSKSKKQMLKEMFQSYQAQLNRWTKQYQTYPNQITTSKLLEQVQKQSNQLKRFYHESGNISNTHPEKLLAQIFALWTIMKSTIDDDIVTYYYQPHPAQIVSIFLCLSFLREDNPKKLQSKMAQIGTGQGKSVVLAGLSSYLAICGFEVNSVCYSGYLSGRDGQEFAPLFQKLQITNKIKYGTFDSVCQSLLNEETKQSKGLRKQIKQLLEEKASNKLVKFFNKISSFFNKILPSISTSKNSNRKIMLIDEVDVFFDPSFFGSLYCPDVCIESPEISALLKYVWQKFHVNERILDTEIKKNQKYKQTEERFSKIKQILEDQVRGMILGCRGCDHDYVVRDDLIQYKDQDGISSKINYGFRTLFAYLKENEKSKISYASLQKALKISLIIAEFSYALLPKYFRSIIGVTGTYQDMSSSKKNYMQTAYDVKAAYIIPSVYGAVRRRQIYQPKIVEPENHYDEIIKQIKEVHSTGRPVLVFFQSSTQLDSFFNFPGYRQLQSKTKYLNETHPSNERDARIKKATNKNSITLMTNAFGRGTDFVIYDQSIFKIGHGGLHVIQTFLSEDTSEQIQIQGRTARQGNPGTYCLIIPSQQLEKLSIKEQNARDNFDNQVKEARSKKQNKDWQQILKRLKESQIKHQKCVETYLGEKTSEDEIIKYIRSLNKYEQIKDNTCKTSIIVDATGSMSAVLKKLLSILREVVKDIIEITSGKAKVSSSQLQIAVYRNYNCPYETLYQSTPFQSQSINLVKFLEGLQACGGMGNEAIQIAFNQLNKLEKLDQIIIIGDAPANTASETMLKRKSKGESYWEKNNVPITDAEQQLNLLVGKKVPIHSFYINSQPHLKTREYFIDISNKTGGQSREFNVNANDSSKMLSQFIAERILEKVASDKSQADGMVAEYRKRHSL